MSRETFTARDETVNDGPVCYDCEHSPCVCGVAFPFANRRTADGKVFDVNGELLEDHGREVPSNVCPHGVWVVDYDSCGACEADAYAELEVAQAAYRAAELIAADGIEDDDPAARVNPAYCADCGILISWQSPEQAAQFPGGGGADYCCAHYTERETIVSARTGRPATLAEIRRAYVRECIVCDRPATLVRDDAPAYAYCEHHAPSYTALRPIGAAAPDGDEPAEHYHVVSFINGCLNDYDSGPYDTLEDARAELARAAADVPDDMHDFIPAGVDRYEQRNGPYILKIESCTEADCDAEHN